MQVTLRTSSERYSVYILYILFTMPSYTNKTKIVFLDLPKKTQENIDEVRKIYNPNGIKRTIAHITFKQDEDFLIENSKLIELIKSQTKTIEPFILKMDGIKLHYDNDNFIVFVSVKKNKRLCQEIAKISKFFEPFIDKKSPNALLSTHWEQSKEFFPHITIITGKGEKEGKSMYNQIISHKIDFKEEITCSTLSISEWDKNHRKTIHQIKL